MAYEIEIKAWVDDYPGVKKKLAERGTWLESYLKHDEYWKLKDTQAAALSGVLRLRRQTSGPEALVTFKNKKLSHGMEINEEEEFTVSDAAVFTRLLERQGYCLGLEKKKTGEAWDVDGVRVELSRLEGLGIFIELEILAQTDTPVAVEHARSRLFTLLDSVGIDRSRVESRFYSELLVAARANGSPQDA